MLADPEAVERARMSRWLSSLPVLHLSERERKTHGERLLPYPTRTASIGDTSFRLESWTAETSRCKWTGGGVPGNRGECGRGGSSPKFRSTPRAEFWRIPLRLGIVASPFLAGLPTMTSRLGNLFHGTKAAARCRCYERLRAGDAADVAAPHPAPLPRWGEGERKCCSSRTRAMRTCRRPPKRPTTRAIASDAHP